MRTTWQIDDDILSAVREIAEREGKNMGVVASTLLRRALKPTVIRRSTSGVPMLPITNPRAVVTMELVNQLRDEAP